MDLHQELVQLIDALEAAGAEYALCGGLALAVHGHPRFTKDIDLLVPAEALANLDGSAYRSFNLVIGDNRDAYWVRSTGEGLVDVAPVPDGLSMITSGEINDMDSPRIRNFSGRFRDAPEPDIDAGDWSAWEALMALRVYNADDGPTEAMCIVTDAGYGTVSSSLIALPAPEHAELGHIWRFSPGRPGDDPYAPVTT